MAHYNSLVGTKDTITTCDIYDQCDIINDYSLSNMENINDIKFDNLMKQNMIRLNQLCIDIFFHKKIQYICT